MTRPGDPIMKIRDVTRTYQVSQGLFRGRRPLQALRGITLDIPKGRVLGLVGESGCGKSTLAQILLGLDRPTGGEILFEDRPIADYGRKVFGSRIQPIFQDPYSSLNPRKTVRQLIEMPLVVHGNRDSADRERRVRRMLDLMGMPSRVIDAYPAQMSGGQRQRIAIARALVTEPDVVICDEPTSALDVSVQAQVLNLLMDLRAEFDLTYLFISHDLGVVEHISDRVAVMYLGQIVEEADAETLFRAPAHPYTKALLASILVPDPHRGPPSVPLKAVQPDAMNLPSGCVFHPRCAEAVATCSVTAPDESVVGDHRTRCVVGLPSH
ncbi:ABC transporter ATP-binding protein [Caenispirillum bisanense]|uniref:Peptide/nickel transport system ATP-binding protein n=1 Tax=Caenispirillum bisanense TaxID=414052 RepID=A0A286GT77_9PROT|nr:oligopeptide/dipeptide ABC transporter ATP-binding protein [Caenispirillum bisanense]SOD98279.1 peptide/nickel transport system ATP-binding protein [Caenispirillum bisanense]